MRLDLRKKDNTGRTICPNCGIHYYPVLDPEHHVQLAIKETFPWQREQMLTGLCCDLCWKKYNGDDGGRDNGE
jgi:hypothetical protein